VGRPAEAVWPWGCEAPDCWAASNSISSGASGGSRRPHPESGAGATSMPRRPALHKLARLQSHSPACAMRRAWRCLPVASCCRSAIRSATRRGFAESQATAAAVGTGPRPSVSAAERLQADCGQPWRPLRGSTALPKPWDLTGSTFRSAGHRPPEPGGFSGPLQRAVDELRHPAWWERMWLELLTPARPLAHTPFWRRKWIRSLLLLLGCR